MIKGVDCLGGGVYCICPDRIETGTFLIAAAISRSYIVCYSTRFSMLQVVLDKFREAGADIDYGEDWVSLDMHGNRPKAVQISTSPYPGFPTDMQSQFSLLNFVSRGFGVITENIFENRFAHVGELVRMGACANVWKNSIFSFGVETLFGTEVVANDLRSSASLILAGCIAEGITIVDGVSYVYRGYENFAKKLCGIGAHIEKFSENIL